MKTIKAVCVGAGNRGIIYSDYAKSHRDELMLIAVVDPNKLHRDEFAKSHGIEESMRFASVEEFIDAHVECDIIINATIDNLHCSTTKPLLIAGYDVLMEKPITADARELIDLRDTAIKCERNLFVCHVLRYTPFYKTIKQYMLDGKIGKICSVDMSEHVGVSHFIESFVVGKWRSEAECGSPFILAKSCHDLDMLCWLNNYSDPIKVASFGERKTFIPENAPDGATEACHTCPHEKSCKYSMTNIFNGNGGTWKRIIHDIDKPAEQITQEDINEELKRSTYGRCVYEMKDLVDRQNVIIKFENGSIGTFNLIGGVARGTRYVHIVGEDGEIFGTHGDNEFTLRRYDFSKKSYTDTTVKIDINKNDDHLGGDAGIMKDLCAYLNGDRSSISITSISDSINGHLCVYAAEKSRKTETIVDIKKEYR